MFDNNAYVPGYAVAVLAFNLKSLLIFILIEKGIITAVNCRFY